MTEDGLSALVDDAYPRCPNDLTALDDAGTVERPYFVCPVCGLVAIN